MFFVKKRLRGVTFAVPCDYRPDEGSGSQRRCSSVSKETRCCACHFFMWVSFLTWSLVCAITATQIAPQPAYHWRHTIAGFLDALLPSLHGAASVSLERIFRAPSLCWVFCATADTFSQPPQQYYVRDGKLKVWSAVNYNNVAWKTCDEWTSSLRVCSLSNTHWASNYRLACKSDLCSLQLK